MRRSAAPSSARIEIIPSRRVAALAGGWALLLCLVTGLGAALPLPARIGVCAAGATLVWLAMRSAVLLRGGGAVHALSWAGDGALVAWVGPARREIPVTPGIGSFRLGDALMCLWLEHHGRRLVVILDAGRQNPGAFRALCRRLAWPPRATGRAQTAKLIPSVPKV